LKIIFFGTPEFAGKVLEFLLSHKIEIVAVVSKPDKPQGRSKIPVPTPVKIMAEKYSIPCFQPEKISDSDFIEVSQNLRPDLFVVVAYGEIIKQHILDLPKFGCINLHASLLPKYRGAAPIQHAVIDGEKETGVSIIRLIKKMDAGDILAEGKVPIGPEETYGDIAEKLCNIGSDLLLQVIGQIAEGTATGYSQNEENVTFAHKIELEDCEIDWTLPASKIHDLIRGVNPEPGAWSYMEINGQKKRMKIFRTRISSETLPVGKPGIDSSKDFFIGCGEGSLQIIELQPEGKKRMSGKDFLRGLSEETFRTFKLL